MKKELEDMLVHDRLLYERLKQATATPLAPTTLEVGLRGDRFYYYLRNQTENGRGPRIPLSETTLSLARDIAQRDYETRVQAMLEERIRRTERFLHTFRDDALGAVYDHLHPARKALVTPLALTFEEWKKQKGEQNPLHTDSRIMQSRSGILVRSKSEKLIADALHAEERFFFYEKELSLGSHSVYPDFTLFSPSLQQEIYWEHFGMMDDPAYANHAIRKLNLYAAHQIILGERLFITMETKDTPLNMEMVKEMMKKMFH